MKVIQRGDPATPWRAGQWRCNGCRSIIEIDATDDEMTVVEFHHNFDHQPYESVTAMKCPVCQAYRTCCRAESA